MDSGRPSMSWSESVDEALCFGWIDGVRKRIDEETYSIRFTPRKPTSIWSAINIKKFEALRAQGRMTDAGIQAFIHRKESKSRIYAYEQEAVAELSTLELRTLQSNRDAWRFFESTPASYKKVIFHWVTTAKRSETRVRRFGAFLKACTEGKRIS